MIPKVKSLSHILSAGAEAGTEFARIMDLLLISEAKRTDKLLTVFNDASGDFAGLDSFIGGLRQAGTTGYQYKFFPSPLSDHHRSEIKKTIATAVDNHKRLKLKKLVIVTPDDLLESGRRKAGGDVSWFLELSGDSKLPFTLEHIGHTKIVEMMVNAPSIALFYYPQLVQDGAITRRTILETRALYNDNLAQTHRNIEFVGMSVYKPEATRGIPMESIYIPLNLSLYNARSRQVPSTRIDPTAIFKNPGRYVILGDPGSGKSTLSKFMLLSGMSVALQQRYNVAADERLPLLVVLRKYADAIKQKPNLPLLTFIIESIQADFSLTTADATFFEFYLKTGHALVFFDGLDELPSAEFKETVRDRIRSFATSYPNNTIVVTSRIVGYDNPYKFSDEEFAHFAVEDLELPQIERFVQDWYQIRIENAKERDDNVRDLTRIVRDRENEALRGLAKNPLLLTIITLVHRIDAVLPDERVVLYQKCTETLLNTWHTWKFREAAGASRGRIERRNRRRIEAIANWMHRRSGANDKHERAIASYDELLAFLTDYITRSETVIDTTTLAEESADEFLEFVKKKAGLLIEVGDGKYSFVHLTFQEYLTASYIITEGETEGIDAVWKQIQHHIDDPRWHEVIRLLVGELKAERSQAYLLDKITALAAVRNEYHITNVLGGLLVDGVIAAVERSGIILEAILRSCIFLRDADHVSALSKLLRRLCVKLPAHKHAALQAMPNICALAERPIDRLSGALISVAMGWPREVGCAHFTKEPTDRSRSARLFRAMYLDEPIAHTNRSDLQSFAALQRCAMLESPEYNVLAVMLVRVNFMLDSAFAWCALWQALLYVLFTAPQSGPLTDFIYNIRAIYQGVSSRPKSRGERARWSSNIKFVPDENGHGDNSFYDRLRDAVNRTGIAAAKTSGQIAALALINERSTRLNSNTLLHRTVEHDSLRAENLLVAQRASSGTLPVERLTSATSWVTSYLDLVVQSLGLTPAAQWKECLQATALDARQLASMLDLSMARAFDIIGTASESSSSTAKYEVGAILLFNAGMALLEMPPVSSVGQDDVQALAAYASADGTPAEIAIAIEIYFACKAEPWSIDRVNSLVPRVDEQGDLREAIRPMRRQRRSAAKK